MDQSRPKETIRVDRNGANRLIWTKVSRSGIFPIWGENVGGRGGLMKNYPDLLPLVSNVGFFFLFVFQLLCLGVLFLINIKRKKKSFKYIIFFLCNWGMWVNLYKLYFLSSLFFSPKQKNFSFLHFFIPQLYT